MKKLTSKEVDEYIKHLQNLSYQQIADSINKQGISESGRPLTSAAIRSRYRRLKLPKKISGHFSEITPEESIQKDREKFREKEDKKLTSKKLKVLLDENEKLQRELSASMEIKAGINPSKIDEVVSSNSSEAIAVVIASDWHIEETVRPETVNGLNKFNLNVAEERVEQFFQNTLKLLIKEQQNAQIDTLVLALLGDFISGNIHDELLENCSLRPIDAIIKAENLLISGINFLLENSTVNLIIPCHVGNHTRITKKVHVSTEKENSLEFFMYNHMKSYFASNPRVSFRISGGYLSYLTLFNNYTICFHHGHAVRYAGGIGGITIGTNKAIAQWQKLNYADLYCFGHYHQFLDMGNAICNGSLIGYNAFAVFIKASPEKPKQTFFLVDRKRGKTVVCPITFDI